MGLNPVTSIDKTFTFDGENSGTYNTHIVGSGVYNAPVRAIEMVNIPNRNGAFALDQGYFENVELVYEASIVANNESEFTQAISELRNWLCSKKNYCRLEDDYNPDEYRMAVYKSGLEVDAIDADSGKFDIVFDCKPQRYLKSGETPITIGQWGETETLEGDIVSFDNPNGYLAFKSLTADIEPIQDLHGYDAPWVGGAGKNKLNNDSSTATSNGITFTVNADGTVTANGTATGTAVFRIYTANSNLPNDAVILNGCPEGGNYSSGYSMIIATSSGTNIGSAVDTGSGASYTAQQLANANQMQIIIRQGTTANNLVFKPMARLSSVADGTYAPYANVCPITGRSEVNVTVADDHDNPTVSESYPTDLERTVYGGSVDLVSGTLTVDRVSVDLAQGMSGGTLSGNYVYFKQLTDAPKAVADAEIANVTAEAYEAIRFNGVATNIGTIAIRGSNSYIYVNTGGQSIAPTGKAVYELATPTTYQLDPQTVSVLRGTNNVWADSGSVTVEIGADPRFVFNPTRFDAQPILEIEGYGNIDLNGYNIEIENVPVGDVILDGFNSALPYSVSFGEVYIKSGDAIDVSYPVANIRARNSTSKSITNATITSTDGFITSATINDITSKTFLIHVLATDPLTFSYGTSGTKTASVFVRMTRTGGTTTDLTFRYTVKYDGNKTITFSADVKTNNYVYVDRATGSSDEIVLHSTELAFGHPTYIDCEIGEAYAIDNGVFSPLNKYIALGSELPTLSVGANTVTYDNTITLLKVTPKWWQV